jgi:hypothetical protein
MKSNMVGWFEIPVSDMDRAVKFYNKVFQIKIAVHNMGELIMGWFPMAEDPEAKGTSGSLVYHKEFYKPSKEGALVYFTSRKGDIKDELSRIEKAGGKILKPKTQISPDHGYMALFLDSEGNRVALHSLK